MSRFRLVTALCLSAFLILGAMWFRFGKTYYIAANVNQSDELIQVSTEEVAQDFIATTKPKAVATAPKVPESLTPTDMVSRQLFSDYMSLKSQNLDTPANLMALASRYSDSILSDRKVSNIGLAQLKTIPDTRSSLIAYNQAVLSLRDKYGALINDSFGGGQFTDVNDPNFLKLMVFAGKLYQQAGNELLAMSVPQSLAANHIDLIENYLSSSQAMDVLSSKSGDPLVMYASLNVFAKNAKNEAKLLSNIQIAALSAPVQGNGI